MTGVPIMQRVLGSHWRELPNALTAHYQYERNTDIGGLTVEYPRAMQPFLFVLKVLGALLDKQGVDMPTRVTKHMSDGRQYWERQVVHPDAGTRRFASVWEYAGGNEVTEFVNPWLGLTMSVMLQDGALHYAGKCFVLRLGRIELKLPEWLLGHTVIREVAVDDQSFQMDFRLIHPLVGQIYRYSGRFTTQVTAR